MNSQNNPKLSYKEMQEQLPDYVFGSISEENKMRFESTLPDYPDLLEEIKQVQLVFSKVEQMDFKRIIDKGARNLSVKVNRRLSTNSSRFSRQRFVLKYLVPTVGMVILAMLIMKNPFSKNQDSVGINKKYTEKTHNVIVPSDTKKIFDKPSDSKENIKVAATLPSKVLPNEDLASLDQLKSEIEEIFTDYLSDSGFGNSISNSDVLNKIQFLPVFDLNEEINKLNEKDLQEILKELGNEKISS